MEATESVKTFGVILHAYNSMQNMWLINVVYATIISRNYEGLTHKMAVKVANAMVSSRLDYCNSLLYHTKRTKISRFYRIQTQFKHVTLCAKLVNSAM